MLQQTQVKTVLPYYGRFLRAFPTVRTLDAARREKVLALWSGLGYYRRAVNLKKAARKIVRDHGGKFPRDFRALGALPGVGPYTAGALMSIAFAEPYPALDANARRVLRRLSAVSREKPLREAAARLVPAARPGDFNQALMDLGATVCLPGEPRCALCPIASFCRARKSGAFRAARGPAPKRARRVEWPLAVIEKNGKILLRRRPDGGLLAGLWEIPGGEKMKNESPRAALLRELGELGGPIGLKSTMDVIRHSITNRSIRAPVYLCALAKAPRPGPGWRWFPLASLDRHPLSSLSLKAARLVAKS